MFLEFAKKVETPKLDKVLIPSLLIGKFPHNAISRVIEIKLVAMEIVVILSKTGNVFRAISIDEYKKARLSLFARESELHQELKFFDLANIHLTTARSAAKFSETWSNILYPYGCSPEALEYMESFQ